MSRFTPKPAVRTGSKCRLALSGPSGAGKTWTSLECAKVLSGDGRVLVIDTERGSAALYSDYYTFDEIAWTPPYDPRELAQVLAENAPSYDVIVVDSLSHFWEAEGGTRDIVDAAASRARGNSFAGWKEGTPAQNDMVAGLLRAPCHVIVTMRSKTEYVLEPDSRGKQVPKRVGMAPIQRQGIEYEFTVTADLDHEHTILIDKTRCHPLASRMFKAGHAGEMAETLRDWLAGAVPGEADEWDLLDDDFARLDDERRTAILDLAEKQTGRRPSRPSNERQYGEKAFAWWRKSVDKGLAQMADPELPEASPVATSGGPDPDAASPAEDDGEDWPSTLELVMAWSTATKDVRGKGSKARQNAVRHAAALYVTSLSDDPGRFHSKDLSTEERRTLLHMAEDVADGKARVEVSTGEPWVVRWTDADGEVSELPVPAEQPTLEGVES